MRDHILQQRFCMADIAALPFCGDEDFYESDSLTC
jgi:hypothetical protein